MDERRKGGRKEGKKEGRNRTARRYKSALYPDEAYEVLK